MGTKWAPPRRRGGSENGGMGDETEAEGDAEPRGRRLNLALLPPLLETLGYLTGGTELYSGFMTVEEAIVWCDARHACFGFSAAVPEDNHPSVVLYMRFSGGDNVLVHHPDWLTWHAWHHSV